MNMLQKSSICVLKLDIGLYFFIPTLSLWSVPPEPAKNTEAWSVGSLSLLWSLLPVLGLFSLFLPTVRPACGLWYGCASQLMLCDRRRENKNCLALVSSKVIYFPKLTESHCRGFIYFYSECHCSVMYGTGARAEWGLFLSAWMCRFLLELTLSPGRVRGSFSGA